MPGFSLTPAGPFPSTLPPFAFVPLGYEQITSLSVATGLTVPAGASIAVVISTGQDVRWRDDSVDPTISIGMLLPENVEKVFFAGLSDLKFIQAGSGAVLNISYY